MTLQEIIRELEVLGLSIDEIAERTNISRASLFRYKAGGKAKNEPMIKLILGNLLREIAIQ